MPFLGREKVVYLAHPVAGNVEFNLANARRLLRKFILRYPTMTFSTQWILECELFDDSVPEEREAGLRRCLVLVSRCDELWLTGRCVSPGMQREKALALSLGKRVIDMTCNEDMAVDLERA